jgi:hypothetical protein
MILHGNYLGVPCTIGVMDLDTLMKASDDTEIFIETTHGQTWAKKEDIEFFTKPLWS